MMDLIDHEMDLIEHDLGCVECGAKITGILHGQSAHGLDVEWPEQCHDCGSNTWDGEPEDDARERHQMGIE